MVLSKVAKDIVRANGAKSFDGIILLIEKWYQRCNWMSNQRTIVKTYKKMKLQEQKTDFEFWQNETSEKRLETLEQIRTEYHAWKYDTQPRFQRVFSIIKR